MSRQISKYRDYINNWKDFCWYLFLPLVLTCALILPSNFSTATLVFINGFMLMMFARIKLKFLLSIIMIAVFGSSIVYFAGKYIPSFQDLMPRSVTWVSRIDVFISPEDDYIKDEGHQLNESKIIKEWRYFWKRSRKRYSTSFLIRSPSDFCICYYC